MTLRQNASIFASDHVAAKLDTFLAGDPDVARWSTYVGRGAVRFYPPLNVQLANDFFAQAVVIAKQYRVSGPEVAKVREIVLQLSQAMGADPNLRQALRTKGARCLLPLGAARACLKVTAGADPVCICKDQIGIKKCTDHPVGQIHICARTRESSSQLLGCIVFKFGRVI
jgi:hypothetical protein